MQTRSDHFPTIARALQIDVARTHALSGWIVMHDPPEYPDKVIARLTTNVASPYVLVADTLAEIHEALPPALKRSARQPAAPPEMVEIWHRT